jgi:uncharacterized protein
MENGGPARNCLGAEARAVRVAAEDIMTHVTKHPHGTFSWTDLATPDPDAAKRFYGELFNLKYVDESMGPEGVYTKLQRNGHDVVGLYKMLPDQQAHGVPAYWLAYITVDDVDAAAAKVEGLGGKLLLKPFEVHDNGRMAVIIDPSGAHLGLWQARRSCGAEVMHEPGTLTWAELASTDVKAAVKFLTGVIGWQTEIMEMGDMQYTVLATAQGGVAGAMQAMPEMGPVPSHWTVYFAVDDCDASAARVQSLGGKVYVPPQDIPGVGRFAICADPQGAVFAMLKASPKPAA